MNPPPNTPPANILIVDDTPANLQLLSEILKHHGYKTRPVMDGKTALAAAHNAPPDLILLDITMPDMDGYEVCRRFKASPTLRDIPVIFISALTETLDKVKAFGCGGVDYVTKPFQFAEVEARVQTHLQLCRQRQELQASYSRLKKVESMRDSLTQMIVHDLRSPLAASIMALGYVSMLLPDMDKEAAQHLETAKALNSQIAEQVNQLLDIGRMETGQMPLQKARHDLIQTARNSIEMVRALSAERQITITASGPVEAVYDEGIIGRVIMNLVANAIKFTAADGKIEIGAILLGNVVRVSVSDNGIGVAPEHHSRIFEKFGQVDGEKRKLGTGLGLAFCQLAIQAHGGTIGIASDTGKGSTFTFSLPSAPADAKPANAPRTEKFASPG